MAGGYLNISSNILKNIPFPKINNSIKGNIINLVSTLLLMKSKGEDISLLEQNIDNLVYKLYNLTYEEVKVIDPEFGLTEEEYRNLKIE